MRPQKTIAYLVPQSIREYVNRRAVTLHTDRKVAISRNDSLAEGDYQDTVSRLKELQSLVNAIIWEENTAIVEGHEDFNRGFALEDRSKVDYDRPQDYNIFWGPCPSGPSSVATAKGDQLVMWGEEPSKSPAERFENEVEEIAVGKIIDSNQDKAEHCNVCNEEHPLRPGECHLTRD